MTWRKETINTPMFCKTKRFGALILLKFENTCLTNDEIGAYVYRNAGIDDCTNNGVSSENNRLNVLLNPDRMEECSDDTLVFAMRGNYIYAVPIGLVKRHSMMGGNFISSSDSRFPFRTAIPIHDRVED